VRYFEDVGVFALDLFRACKFDRDSFDFRVHERPIKVRLIPDILQVVGGQRLRRVFAEEGINHPASVFAVEGAYDGFVLNRQFIVHLAGTLEFGDERTIQFRVEVNCAGNPLRLDGLGFLKTASRGQHFGDDFVGGLRRHGLQDSNSQRNQKAKPGGGERRRAM